MSLTNALFSSVSGLDTASTSISVIGDNIANANTPGFKEKRAQFSAEKIHPIFPVTDILEVKLMGMGG